MCTINIKVNDTLLDKARVKMDSDVDIAEWMQQQIEAILVRIALSSERKTRTTSHSWDNYELSPEILAMTPKRRHNISGNYKAELSDLLEEKYG
jgi:hypothetical protein